MLARDERRGFVSVDYPGGFWQTNSNQSHLGQRTCPLSRAKAAPLGESGGTVQLEVVSGGEAAVLIEVVADEGVDGDEFLQTLHPPEPEHGPLASSERQM